MASFRRTLARAAAAALAAASFAAATPANAAVTPINVVEATDPGAKFQWNLDQIGAPEAWQIANGKAQTATTLAYIDTNIETSSADFSSRLVTGYDFRMNQAYPNAVIAGNSVHGTMGAHLAVGNTNNGQYGAGVTGPNSAVKLMPLKMVDESDFCSFGNISLKPGTVTDPYTGAQRPRMDMALDATIRSMDYAVNNGAKVINLSLGTYGTPAMATQVQAFRAKVAAAQAKGVLVVAASGNDNYNEDRLRNEGVVLAQAYDPANPNGSDGCPTSWVGGSFQKYGNDLTATEKTYLANGTGDTVDQKDNTGKVVKTWQRRYIWLYPAGTRAYPGAFSSEFDNVVTVSGTAKSDAVSRWGSANTCPADAKPTTGAFCGGGANYGSFADVAAPAQSIPMFAQGLYTLVLSSMAPLDGTSFASPQVAGAAAMLRSLRPDLTAAQVKTILKTGTSKTNLTSGTFASTDLFSLPRMLEAAGVATNPKAPGIKLDPTLTAPVRNATNRTYTYTDNVTVPNNPIVKRELTVVDQGGNKVTAVTTGTATAPASASLTVAPPLNGAATATLKVTDSAGNTRVLPPTTHNIYGARRDIVDLTLQGTTPYTLKGDIVSGNLQATKGIWQRLLSGTAVVKNAAGQNVTLTLNLGSDLLGYNPKGTIQVQDPVKGTFTVTLPAGATTMDYTAATDSMQVGATGLTGTYTGVSLNVRDTDD